MSSGSWKKVIQNGTGARALIWAPIASIHASSRPAAMLASVRASFLNDTTGMRPAAMCESTFPQLTVDP